MKLNELRDNPGATKRAKRVGRGPGSGRGGTSGRGQKGQKSRSGVAIKGFEGGQMPLYQRLPKRGFVKPNRKAHAVVNLGLIQKFVDEGKIDAAAPITEEVLVKSGLVRRRKDGIRVLAKGAVTSKLDIAVTGASQAAVDAVAKAGGTLKAAVGEKPKKAAAAPKAKKAKKAAAPDAPEAAPASEEPAQDKPDATAPASEEPAQDAPEAAGEGSGESKPAE